MLNLTVNQEKNCVDFMFGTHEIRFQVTPLRNKFLIHEISEGTQGVKNRYSQIGTIFDTSEKALNFATNRAKEIATV